MTKAPMPPENKNVKWQHTDATKKRQLHNYMYGRPT